MENFIIQAIGYLLLALIALLIIDALKLREIGIKSPLICLFFSVLFSAFFLVISSGEESIQYSALVFTLFSVIIYLPTRILAIRKHKTK